MCKFHIFLLSNIQLIQYQPAETEEGNEETYESYAKADFGGHGQLIGGKGRGTLATGKLVACQTYFLKVWQTKMVAN